jgi:hypothetical protein
MSAQPQWITPAGTLGTIPEGVFYSTPLVAVDPLAEDQVYYALIAGRLPEGMQIQQTGILAGVPSATITVQGVPAEVGFDVTTKFVVRAYTQTVVNSITVVNRLADRTFELTVTGQDAPEFTSPSGQLAQYYDGTVVTGLQVGYTDTDPDQTVIVRLIAGQLPPGLTISSTGLISGFIPVTALPEGTGGWSANGEAWDEYPWSFSTIAESNNYEFVLEASDGFSSTLRTFTIFVWARNTMTADNTIITADNTFITADVSPVRAPLILNPTGTVGTVRNDNFFAYRFNGVDLDNEAFTIFPIVTIGTVFNANVNPPGNPQTVLNNAFPAAVTGSGVIDQTLDELWVYDGTVWDNLGSVPVNYTSALPPGLTVDPTSGWLYGLIPDTGISTNVYPFSLLIKKTASPDIFSGPYNYSLTVTGPINSEIIWLTPSDPVELSRVPSNIGSIVNGSISTLYVKAQSLGGVELQYELYLGIEPEITTVYIPTGSSGTTLRVESTQGISVGSLIVGTGFSSGQTVLFKINETTLEISAPPNSTPGNQLTFRPLTESTPQYNLLPQGLELLPSGDIAGRCSFNTFAVDGGTTTFDVSKQNGADPTTFDLVRVFTVRAFSVDGVVNVTKTFSITVIRQFNNPYENLYIQCMPPQDDRNLINSLLQNSDIFPPELLYRSTDPNFGVATRVVYNHAYGLTAATIQEYYNSLEENHYWKNLVLGEIKTAQARDSTGQVIYEVVYSQVIDNLVNNAGESVNKVVKLPFPIDVDGSIDISSVTPNSLINMRDQVIDTVGQTSNILPAWMISQQPNGSVLGFVPAWVIAYTKPGQAEKIAYYIRTQFDQPLNLIDFEVDRYELDRLLTKNWDPATDSWVPSPPSLTTFDIAGEVAIWENNLLQPVAWTNDSLIDVSWVTGGVLGQGGTTFDQNSMQFIAPVDMYSNTQEYDKYLVFRKRNILE